MRPTAMSVLDRLVDLSALLAKNPPWQVMGNVNCFVLHEGPADLVARYCERLAAGGIRLISPACGIVPTTPVSHLRAMGQARNDV